MIYKHFAYSKIAFISSSTCNIDSNTWFPFESYTILNFSCSLRFPLLKDKLFLVYFKKQIHVMVCKLCTVTLQKRYTPLHSAFYSMPSLMTPELFYP